VTYAERLKQWAAARGKEVHERVLSDGQHHVWVSLFPGWRCDVEGRDYEEACRCVWREVWQREHWGAPRALSPVRALLLSAR
jgi:hypothetical protein